LLDGGGGSNEPEDQHNRSTHNYPVYGDSIVGAVYNTTHSYPVKNYEQFVMNQAPADEHHNIANDEAIAHALEENYQGCLTLSILPLTLQRLQF
jgi:hypothetical protein